MIMTEMGAASKLQAALASAFKSSDASFPGAMLNSIPSDQMQLIYHALEVLVPAFSP